MASNERLEALQAELSTKVATLTDTAEWKRWLTVAAKFHTYSFNNQMLILMQRPDATRVAGFRKWQELGRQVRKGEKSIGIFAPSTRKETDDNGDQKTRVIGFRIVSVFDVEQTDGDPLPEAIMPTLLDGEAPTGLWDALAAMVTGNGYTLERGDCGGANGYTSPSTHTVKVRDDVSDAQACKTLIHEVAHMLLHCDGDDVTITHRGVAEVEAESTAYVVANVHGLPTDDYTLPYVAAWAGENGNEKIVATGQKVVATAKKILAACPVRELEGATS